MTRVGAAVAMFLFLNYMLAKGRMFWSPDSEDAAVFFIALVVFLGRAGRVWGVEAISRSVGRNPRFGSAKSALSGARESISAAANCKVVF
jgi:hypothetical protein